MEFADIDPEDVTVGSRHRSVTETKVKALAESMQQIGLQQPISVWCPTDTECYLVAGLHRLRAAILLKWGLIPCILVEMDEADRQMWEIDENLCRSELTPSEITLHMAERKKIWESKGGASCTTPGGRQEIGFAKDTAAKTGRSKHTINRAVARSRMIAPDVLQDMKGTVLDTGAGQDRLAKLTHEEQRRAVADGKLPGTARAMHDAAPEEQRPAGSETTPAAPEDRQQREHRPTADVGMWQPPAALDLHELVDRLAARLPDKLVDDGEAGSYRVYLMGLLDEMSRPAAELCDLLIEVDDRAAAEAIANVFRIPMSLMPLTYGEVRNAVSAAKLKKKELRALGCPNFLDLGGHGDNELSVEDLHQYRKLLDRVGITPEATPVSAEPAAPAPAGPNQEPAGDDGGKSAAVAAATPAGPAAATIEKLIAVPPDGDGPADGADQVESSEPGIQLPADSPHTEICSVTAVEKVTAAEEVTGRAAGDELSPVARLVAANNLAMPVMPKELRRNPGEGSAPSTSLRAVPAQGTATA